MATKAPVVSLHPPDYHTFLDDCGDRGKPLSTIGNLRKICERLGVTIRYNAITKTNEILIAGLGFPIDNQADAAIEWLISECAKFRMPTGNVPGFVTHIAATNHYNPVVRWIESKPWDGQDRLLDLVHTVVAKDEMANPAVHEMKRVFITRWMISAVAAAFLPDGVSAHGVLVFQGEQYVGKTKWFKNLAPASLGVVKDGLLLRPDDRDSVMRCISNWLVELGELDATFRKSDIASLKAFLTSDRDVLRRAYARGESHYPRRTVFFASVNPANFLHDDTGNRRYWTIEVDHLDYDHQIDMQQCWAQVHALYVKGESWYLTDQEFKTLNVHNSKFEASDQIADLVDMALKWEATEGWTLKTATEVLMRAGLRNPSRADVTRAGMIIRGRNGDQGKRGKGGSRLLLVPPYVFSSTAQDDYFR